MDLERAKRYIGITLGCFIAGCSINVFLVPAHLFSGGLTGIAMIVYYLINLPIGTQVFILNIPLLVASYKLLGKKYTVDVIFGTLVLSFWIDAMSFLQGTVKIEDAMLAAIFGGIFNGIGYGIVFRMDGSTGGFDVLAAICHKYLSFHMGGVIFTFNCCVMAVAAFIFNPVVALYTLISMYVNGAVVDKVIAGFNKRKAVLLISDKRVEIAQDIINEVGRGVTFLHGAGAYTHMQRDVLFVAVKLTQLAKIKLIAARHDPKAFIIILSANEVSGRGFTLPGSTAAPIITDEDREILNNLKPAKK